MSLLIDYIKEVENSFDPLEIESRIYNETYVRNILSIESKEMHRDLKDLIKEMASAEELKLRSPVDRLIYNEEYVQDVLGIKIPLNESYPYSSKLQEVDAFNAVMVMHEFLRDGKERVTQMFKDMKKEFKGKFFFLGEFDCVDDEEYQKMPYPDRIHFLFYQHVVI